MPFSHRIGLETVVESTRSNRTACLVAAIRPAKPIPTGTRTPWRTSSSMPHAALATSPSAPLSKRSTAAVSTEMMSRTRASNSSSKLSRSRDVSLVSVSACKSARRPSSEPAPELDTSAYCPNRQRCRRRTDKVWRRAERRDLARRPRSRPSDLGGSDRARGEMVTCAPNAQRRGIRSWREVVAGGFLDRRLADASRAGGGRVLADAIAP